MITPEWVFKASERIKPLTVKTPISHDPKLNVFFKWENYQATGSFKLRGATNKVFSLDEKLIKGGLVTCSAGNHGQGVAVASAKMGSSCIVFASDHAASVKIEAMKQLGADVRLVAGGYVEAERTAIAFAQTHGMPFISPYNDELVIAGQGTIGVELLKQLERLQELKALLVPVGGGGLISGLGVLLSSLQKKPLLIGVQSEASAFAFQVFNTGKQNGVIETESIAEGLAGEIEDQSITIPLMHKYVDDILLVSEEEIREAIRYCWVQYNERIEGSAAVGLAARLTGKIQSGPVAVVITGGNIQPELWHEIIKSC